MPTRVVTARVSESLEAAARARAPELAALDTSTLLRVALAALADPAHDLAEAVKIAFAARRPSGGPRPGAGAKKRIA